MAGLADELRGRRRHGARPTMDLILETMSDADRKEWIEVLLDEEIMSIRICGKLKSMGHSVSTSAVGVYRQRLKRDSQK